jgi:alanine-glyoxylate transaminase/serine-glyoxylate transaminase/serine-pyruvate transaminase
VQADLIEARLKADTAAPIKAVCVVHNETSTGVTSNIAAVRRAIDAAKHPALLMVDSISGLASAEYRHDAWGVDVTVSGSQKGLMLPPGISFNALSPKAIEASKTHAAQGLLGLGRNHRDEQGRLLALHPQHQPAVRPERSLRHAAGPARRAGRHVCPPPRWGEGVRAAVRAWGLPIQCADPRSIRRC